MHSYVYRPISMSILLAFTICLSWSAAQDPAGDEKAAARIAGIFDALPLAGKNPEGAAALQGGAVPAAQSAATGEGKDSQDIIVVKRTTRRKLTGIEGMIDRFFRKLEDQIAMTISAFPVLAATGVIRWANKALFNVLERWIPMAAWAASPVGTIIGVVLVGLVLGFFIYWILSGDDRKPIPKEKKKDDQKKYNRIAR